MTPKMFRQGDVLIVSTAPVEDLGYEVPMEEMGPVLAYGEVTGHHHTVLAHPETYDPHEDLPDYHPVDLDIGLRDWAAQMLQQIDKDRETAKTEPAARLYKNGDEHRRLVVSRPTILRHEEHPAIFLEPGHYKIIQQKEFTPQGWVKVQD